MAPSIHTHGAALKTDATTADTLKGEAEAKQGKLVVNKQKRRKAMRRTTNIWLTVAALVFVHAASFAQELEKDFVRTGQHQSLIQSWSVFGGVTTSQRWSGLIEVIVSGFGVNVPATGILEDAFYPIVPAAPDVPFNQPGALPPSGLHLSFTGCSAAQECGAPRIESFLVYVDDVGFVQPPATTIEAFLKVIPYSPEHVYRIVIDIGATPQFLTLGHGDGGVFDNSGFFAIQLFSVKPKKGGPKL